MLFYSSTDYARMSMPIRARVPCWPNPSTLTLLLTRDLRRILYPYVLVGIFALLTVMLLFAPLFDSALRLLGHEADVVSYFPFLRIFYFRLLSYNLIPATAVSYFHILDVALWLSLAVWGGRLAAGIVALKQYDDLYLKLLRRLAGTPRGQLFVLFLGAVLLVQSPLGTTYLMIQPKVFSAPEFILLMTYLPAVYFLMFGTLFWFGGFILSELLVFLLWVVVRRLWPGVVLWRDTKPRGNADMTDVVHPPEIAGRT
jgi:hypothetical protein